MSILERLKQRRSMTLLLLKWHTAMLLTACAMLIITQLTGCASTQPLPVVQCQTIPPPPAMAMKKFKPVYRQRLQSELLESVPSAIK